MADVVGEESHRPNVLFLAIDDLRCELGCYGVKEVKSPRIDEFAESAVTFTRAYVQVAVCNPSRVAVMTGLRPDTTKVWDLPTRFRETTPDAVTIPQHFREHGYTAVSFGKIFHNPWPDNQSWDQPHEWPKDAGLWSEEAKQKHKEYRQQMKADGKPPAKIQRMRAQALEALDIPDSQHIDGGIADQAISAMRELSQQDKPFFLAAGFVRPHLPFVVPKKYWDMYDRGTIPLADNQYLPKGAPELAFGERNQGGLYELRDYYDFADTPSLFEGSLSEDRQRALKHGYYASISMIDTHVGRLLDELKSLKLEEETIVVIWSDHGWKLGEHNGWCKQTNYEIDSRTPLMIRVPEMKSAGQKCNSLTEFIDIYPTLSELAGLPLRSELEGQSLKPVLENPQSEHKQAAFSQYIHHYDGKHYMGYAMRTDRYRYIEWLNRETFELAERELYDHETDPQENQNIASKTEQKLLDQLSNQMWSSLPKPVPPSAKVSQAKKRPNILVLMGDDWSAPHAGFLGDPVVKTPTFDRLAKQGVVFENAFVSSPSCTPSRMAIVTGQWHWRLDEAQNLGGSLGKNVPVYPDLLKEVGYNIGFARKGASPSKHTYRGNDPFGPRFKTLEVFLKNRDRDQPFCFWYGAGEPHRPYRAGAGIAAGLDPEKVLIPAGLPNHPTVRSDLCDYYERIQRFDRDSARMLKYLEQMGELDNTLIIVSGDNGLPFPRCKATLYDTGTKVPLVIHWPGKFSGGRRVTDFVNLTDLAPTILEAVGENVPTVMTGRSLIPILKSPQSGRIEKDRDFTITGMERHLYSYPARALRTDDYLYIQNYGPNEWPSGESKKKTPNIDFTDGSWPNFPGAFSYNIDPSPTKQLLLEQRDAADIKPFFELACAKRPQEELYDLTKDPGQLTNVADDPEVQKSLNKLRTKLGDELLASGDHRAKVSTTPVSNQLSPPNILFIAMDDLNDWIGCMGGHPQTITPNLDRLAKSGVFFTNAHCPAPACNPSRTAIMTGISPHVSGLYDNGQKMREILPKAEIMPKTFSGLGYHSSGSGKMLHYFIDADSWDEYYPEAKSENPFPRTLYPETRPLSLPKGGPWQYVETDWGPLDATDEEFGGDYLVSKWVGEQLQVKRNVPFFLACGIYRPHEPWFVPAKYFEPFPLESIQLPPGYKQDDLDDLPPAGKKRGPNRYFEHIQNEGQWKQGVQGYLASIHFADAMLGRVLDALEKSPHADTTIVVLWSDHGWHLGEKEHWQKFTGWRQATRVPLMIRVPEGTPAFSTGTKPAVCDRPVNLLSLFPTLLELCGQAPIKHLDGPSLVPLLRDPKAEWPHASHAFLGERGSVAISTDHWRYLKYEGGDEELYNIAEDPYEWTNLAALSEHATKLNELRKLVPKKFAPKPEPSVESLISLKWQVVKNQPIPVSKPDGSTFSVHFLNKSDQTVKLFWRDLQGGQKFYADIAPGKQKTQSTRPGAVWLMTDEDEKPLGYFRVGDRTAKAIVPKP
jgi:arylsulfatase A-like enzyme